MTAERKYPHGREGHELGSFLTYYPSALGLVNLDEVREPEGLHIVQFSLEVYVLENLFFVCNSVYGLAQSP